MADSHESCCWPQLSLRGEEKEDLQLNPQNRSHCYSLGPGAEFAQMVPIPGHIAEKEASTLGSNQGLRSVHLEHAQNCWKPNKEYLAGQERMPSLSSGVATHRNGVGCYPEWKNIAFLSFHENRISYHQVPYTSLLPLAGVGLEKSRTGQPVTMGTFLWGW